MPSPLRISCTYGKLGPCLALLRSLLLAILLPNAAFILASQLLDLGRPWINLDYSLAVLAFAVRWQLVGALLFVTFFLIDLMVLSNQIFPIVRLADAWYLIGFTLEASLRYQLLLLGIVLLLGVLWAILARRGPSLSPRLAGATCALLLALGGLSYATDKEAGDSFYRAINEPAVASQTQRLLQTRSQDFLLAFNATGTAVKPLEGAAASDEWHQQLAQGTLPGERLLLIVNESWGIAQDPRVHQALLAPLTALQRPLREGQLNFIGPTLSGELRELCRLQPRHFNLKDDLPSLSGCLPERLKTQGYATASLHGAVSLMYDRHLWYPRIGFTERTFFESRAWPQRCYSFPGACDLDLREEVRHFFAQPGRRFMYWLTLNSHSIYDERDIRIDAFDCAAFAIDPQTESCRNLRLQAQFFQGLAELLASDALENVKVLMVGDHVPIIFSNNERQAHFVEGQVPWLQLHTQSTPPTTAAASDR